MSFKVTKKALWESGGSLQRFGQLKFKGQKTNWKAGRIHKAATAELAKITEENQDALLKFGAVEVQRTDRMGNKFPALEIQNSAQVKDFSKAWEVSLTDKVELPLDPFKLEELPAEFWGQDEEKDADGKIIRPKIEAMLDTQDIGALGEWLIVGDVEKEPAE